MIPQVKYISFLLSIIESVPLMNYNNIIKIGDSKVGDLHFPACICPYQNKGSYTMVEVNTGSYKGSIKYISQEYRSYQTLVQNFDMKGSSLPFLKNYIIYNDTFSRL